METGGPSSNASETVMNFHRNRSADRGFTLVELLVVIVVLGVLAGVVVFAVNGISNRGQTSACAQDISTLRTAEESYYAVNSSYADEATLVSAGLITGESTLHDITVNGDAYAVTAASNCATVSHADGFEPPDVTAANNNSFYTRAAPNSIGSWTINSGSVDVVAANYWGNVATMGISAGNTIDLIGAVRRRGPLVQPRRHPRRDHDHRIGRDRPAGQLGSRPVYASSRCCGDAAASTGTSGLNAPLRWSSVSRP
jgi:general secretion pathway protein G